MKYISFKTRGKVSSTNANLLLNGMLSVLYNDKALMGRIKSCIDDVHGGKPDNGLHPPLYTKIYNALRYIAEYDITSPDSDERFAPYKCMVTETLNPGRTRLAPYSGLSLIELYYSDKCNDTHWLTVQKQVKGQLEELIISMVYS